MRPRDGAAPVPPRPAAGRRRGAVHRRRASPRARLAASLAAVIVLGAAVGLVVRLALGHGGRNGAATTPSRSRTAASTPSRSRTAASTAGATAPPVSTTTPHAATTLPTTATTLAPLLSPRQVLVEVLNGSGATGLAGATAAALRGRGFAINGTGNAPTYTFLASVVEYSPGSVAAARTVAAELTGAAVFRRVAGLAPDEVDLVVGARFRGLVPG
ncbi:MAG TPA: LytR C-terminal domain-containing protein [Acidimicrobiales bacterium]|nr:LytR C-terminal domain-containing protein [Acidimicrobiales bacterium]